jgi:hypothetical protein
MANEDLIIPIHSENAFTPDLNAPVRGGGSRMVRMVPTGIGLLPIIWISHKITTNEQGVPVYNCLLLDNKDPPHTSPAEITVDAFRHKDFPMVAVEW